MMSMPPGPPVVPSNGDMDDDAFDPDDPSEEADEETATAEALGYSEPEDAPTTGRGDDDREGRPSSEA